MINVLLVCSTLFFATWVFILKMRKLCYERQLNAICDALLLYAKHDYKDSHSFVQTLKIILNGEY